MRKRPENFNDHIARLYPELHGGKDSRGNNVLSKVVTFQVTDACNLCCFPAGTRVLMGDFSEKEIQDVRVGDIVIGFDEEMEQGSYKHVDLYPTKVTHTFVRHDAVRKITSADGGSVVCTDEHPFLTDRKTWRRAEDLNPSTKVMKFTGAPEYTAPDLFDGKSMLKREKIDSNERVSEEFVPVFNIETESHTYIANDFAVHNCTYCYQHNKGHKVMSWETAKKFVDLILSGDKGFKDYISPEDSPGIVLDFIGGEPTLQIELIDRIIDYFREQALLQGSPWAVRYMTDICSNGTTYQNPNVQRILKKHERHLSFSVSLDGDKALHDACRVFPDGRGSYDLAEYAAKDWMNNGHFMGSKITISPQNVMHAFSATKHMLDLGYEEINMNCVFEEGWTEADGTILYHQLKKIADYMLENDLEDLYFAMFEENFFHPKAYDDDDNWCWGAGTPVLTTKGYKPIENIEVGDKVITHDGTYKTVVRATHHFAKNVVNLHTKVGNYVCTSNHKVFAHNANDEEFVRTEVQNLKSDSVIRTYIDGEFGEITGFNITKHDPCKVYNITVDTNHSYIAGSLVSSNCGGTGSMLACDPDGNLFPCIRYMDSSLNGHQPALKIGDVDRGLLQTPEEAQIIKCMDCVTRSSQSTQECMDCPIAEGCAWCFEAGTIVNTPDGFKNIEDIKIGDKVLDMTGTPQNVIRATSHVDNDLCVVKACGFKDTIVTKPHPFWTKRSTGEVGWVAAGDLNTTDEIALYDPDSIDKKTWVQVCEPIREVPDSIEVFNIEVENNPTYIANGALVHNCSGYNYEKFGTVNHRATFICPMHKARSLANVYYWNKCYQKHNEDKKFKMYCPKEWAVPIIGEEEYAMLKELSEGGGE